MLAFRVLIVFLFLAAPSWPADDPTGVPNLKHPRENILTAGQPTEQGLQELVGSGARVVINLRPHDEAEARDESDELASLGVKYYNIPITPDTITFEKVREFTCLLKANPTVPVLIHCASGNRVGGMWALFRVLAENAGTDEAILDARAIGMKPTLEPIILKKIEEFDPQKSELKCP